MTKISTEQLAGVYHRCHGVPVVGLRYFTVYGPRQRPDMAFHRFITRCLDDEPIQVIGDGRQIRDFTYVTDAVVIGDRRPYLSAIVMIEQVNVEKYAQDHDVPFSNYASLTRSPEVRALIEGEIAKVNAKFARVEQIKKFYLLDTQLSAEDEELTPTMKLKRKLVQQKYAPQIEAMYQ